MENGRHFYIEGKVQGVYFRASTQQRANELSLRGWVRNLQDGRVEVVAYGASEALDELAHWLSHGPERARVDQLIEDDMPEEPAPADFSIR